MAAAAASKEVSNEDTKNVKVVKDAQTQTAIKAVMATWLPSEQAHRETLANIIVQQIINSKEVHLLHSTISQPKKAHMMQIAGEYIQANRAIPVLIAAGLKFPPLMPDVSELSALSILYTLQHNVQKFYAPGLELVMRMEDLTMCEVMITIPSQKLPDEKVVVEDPSQTGKFYVPATHPNPNVHKAYMTHYAEYIRRFKHMASSFGDKSDKGEKPWIKIVTESEMMKFEDHHTLINKFSTTLCAYFVATQDVLSPHPVANGGVRAAALTALGEIGFKGEFGAEERQYFLRCYSNRYPKMSVADQYGLMSRYLACTLARRHLHAVGDHKSWSPAAGGAGRFEISFVEPIPNSKQFEQTRVWYKSSHHGPRAPFWRATGLFDPRYRNGGLKFVDLDDSEFAKKRAQGSAFEVNGVSLTLVCENN